MGEGDAWAYGAYSTNPIWYQYYGRRRTPNIKEPASTILLGEYADVDKSIFDNYYFAFTVPAELTTHHLGGGNVLWNDGHATAETQTSLVTTQFEVTANGY